MKHSLEIVATWNHTTLATIAVLAKAKRIFDALDSSPNTIDTKMVQPPHPESTGEARQRMGPPRGTKAESIREPAFEVAHLPQETL
ncbi:hypothetical protein DSLASN_04100 [Desulfoluna limicola]|uniref:Uncharacterized protein n=1 Tax=Desulfoluna limicola TaxID=2810562 RepID=A0ABN6EWP1_9BACT|nr:hypothetical protein [Desulfoluna limicola]BCS94778.1 hypothetical protein DSLASN_04100 [Desulfoluna limicola]